MSGKHNGKPCRTCGATLHYNNGGCVACHIVKSRKWNAENRERRRAVVRKSDAKYRDQRREYWTKNRDRLLEQKRAAYAKNKSAHLGKCAAYKKANKDQVNANCAARRARANNPGNKYKREDVARMFDAQMGLCVYCRTFLSKYHVDHILPLALGGSNDPSNLQLLCPPCNRQKHATHPDKFRLRSLELGGGI